MMRVSAVIAQVPGLGLEELGDWVARGWVRVEGATAEEWLFAEVEVTRVRLIRDLRLMAIQEDTLPVVLGLVEEVHALRSTLAMVLRAVEGQPEDVRAALRRLLDVAGHPSPRPPPSRGGGEVA